MEKLIRNLKSNDHGEKLAKLDDLSRECIISNGSITSRQISEIIQVSKDLLGEESIQVICKVQYFLQLITPDLKVFPVILEDLIRSLFSTLRDRRPPIYENSVILIDTLIRKCQQKVIKVFEGLDSDLKEEIRNLYPKIELLADRIDLESVIDYFSDPDWKFRQSVIDYLSKLPITDPESIDKILLIISKGLKDTNPNVLISTINLLTVHVQSQEHINLLIDTCMLRLGDKKVSIRQPIFKLIVYFLAQFNSETIYPKIIACLSDENWLIRLESLHILIYQMLQFPKSMKFFDFLPDIASLMNDSKSKIRFSAAEALAIMNKHYDSDKLIEKIKPILNTDAISYLTERFSKSEVASVIDYNIEFPRLGMAQSVSRPSLLLENIQTERVSLTPNLQLYSKSTTKRNTEGKPSGKLQLDENLYIKYEDLTPLKDLMKSLDQVYAIDDKSSWTETFEALNIIRRALKHHMSQINDLNATVKFLCESAESPRSSLRKNAIIAIGEAFKALGNTLDRFIPEVLKVLMGKVCESSFFIYSEAQKALEISCENTSENKMVSCIQSQFSNAKNAAIKANICMCFAKIFSKTGQSPRSLKEFGFVKELLNQYTSDASPVVRDQARKALKMLEPCISSLPACIKGNKSLKVQSSRVKHSENLHENQDLSKISSEVFSINSKNRFNGLVMLGQLIEEQSSSLGSPQKLSKLVDIVCKTLQDRNMKIQIKSLSIFEMIIPIFKDKLSPFTGNILEASVTTFNSKIENIKKQTLSMCNCMIEFLDPCQITLGLVHIFNEVDYKVKDTVVELLKLVIRPAHRRKPKMIESRVKKLVSQDSELQFLQNLMNNPN